MCQIKFHPCLFEEALQLQQVVEASATYADDTLDLGTAFLIIKDIEVGESLEGSIDPVVLANGFLDRFPSAFCLPTDRRQTTIPFDPNLVQLFEHFCCLQGSLLTECLHYGNSLG